VEFATEEKNNGIKSYAMCVAIQQELATSGEWST